MFDVEEKIANLTSIELMSYLDDMREHLTFDASPIGIPRFVNVFDRIEELQKEKRQAYREYHDLYARMISSKQSINPFQDAYESLVLKIQELDSLIQNLNVYKERANPAPQTDIVSPKTSAAITPKAAAKKFIKNRDKQHVQHASITYYVELPDPNHPMKKKVELAHKKEVPPPIIAPSKPTKKVKYLTTKEKEIIKHNVKKLISGKFKFQNKDECTSRKHSQPYYMSKEKLVEIIDGDNELKAIVPSNYKTLSKEQLCTYIFPEKN